MKIVTINEHTYQMSDSLAGTVLKTAKDAMKDKNAICALVKGNVIMMKNDTFPDIDSLKKEVKNYIKQGFKVRYTMGGGSNGKV